MGKTQRAGSADVGTAYLQHLSWQHAKAALRPRRTKYRAQCEEAAPARNIPSTPITLQGSELDAVFVSPTPRGQQADVPSIWRVQFTARSCWPRTCWHRQGALQACIYEQRVALQGR